jgi:hypothetical protein
MVSKRFKQWMPYAEITLIGCALAVAGLVYAIARLAGN